jgi:hypothetical protein
MSFETFGFAEGNERSASSFLSIHFTTKNVLTVKNLPLNWRNATQ